MAYITQHKNGWQAQVARLGIRQSKVFVTKTEAKDWANRLEAEIVAGKVNRYHHTFKQAVEKYKADVSTKKDGEKWERMRLDGFLAHFADVPLSEIQAPQIAGWRDARLKQVSASTVVREANLLRNLFNLAKKEWHWCEHYPFDGVKMPQENQPRQSMWGWKEIKRVLRADRVGKTKEMQDAFHIALRTGMRLGEVLQAPENFDGSIVRIKTKTEKDARIPIGRIARKLLKREPFTVGPNEGSVLFSKLCRELMIEGLTFHDTRGTALTHLARKVDVLTLAKISRHKDISLLSNVYYRKSANEISKLI